MKVAGFGFRKGARTESLHEALALTGTTGVTHVATVEGKHDAACLTQLAADLNLPLLSIAPEALADMPVTTHSDKSVAMYGTGSVSEAVALKAAGTGAHLLAPRTISSDKMATCAVALQPVTGDRS